MSTQDTAAARIAAIEKLLEGHTDRRDEEMILSLLSDAEDATLDATLQGLDLSRLLGDVDDRPVGPKHYTALLQLLSQQRVGALTVPTRAQLISALQRGRTGKRDESAIAALLLATKGSALTELKNALDRGRDHRDLQQLVFSDIDDDALRAAILDHFRAEAPTDSVREVKVLSDLDDTFYANWKDDRYPKKTVYPGVLSFYAELDSGPTGDGRMGDLAFVTARPRDRPGIIERLTHDMLRERGLADATVLAGSFFKLLSHDSMADKKVANFVDYVALFPEYDFVFVGDSGQGDATFGKRMYEQAADRVKGVFIHDVMATSAEERERWATERVSFFDTYIGAGCMAFKQGLIAAAGLQRIVDAARSDLEALTFGDAEQKELRAAELEKDATRASELSDGP
jgi:hypothetical protein